MSRSIIKIRDMSFEYNQKEIFNDVNLDIYENSFTAIIGPNGSGKKTLAKLLAGLYDFSGYINIDGYLLNHAFINKIRRIFSCSFEEKEEYFGSVREILAFPLENLQYSKKEINNQIQNIAKKFKIENILDKDFNEISPLEKNKVSVASALIYNPKILLLTKSPIDKKLIFKILKEYQKEHNLTVILITNDLEDTLEATNIIVLKEGKVLKEGTPREIYNDDYLEKIGLKLPFIVSLSQNLMLYDLLDKVYLKFGEVGDKLWP